MSGNLPEDYYDLPKISEGYPKNREPSGLTRSEYMKQYRQNKKKELCEYNKRYQRKYYKENQEKYLFWQLKNRARKLNVPFDLEVGDITIPHECPILKIPLEKNVGGRGPKFNSPSVDRIQGELGYVRGNIQVISYKANTMKNDATPEMLERFADWVKNQLIPSLKT